MGADDAEPLLREAWTDLNDLTLPACLDLKPLTLKTAAELYSAWARSDGTKSKLADEWKQRFEQCEKEAETGAHTKERKDLTVGFNQLYTVRAKTDLSLAGRAEFWRTRLKQWEEDGEKTGQ